MEVVRPVHPERADEQADRDQDPPAPTDRRPLLAGRGPGVGRVDRELAGHEHESTLAYRWNDIDVFKPRAAYMGGFAVVRVTDLFMDVAFAEVTSDHGELKFTRSFSKQIAGGKK